MAELGSGRLSLVIVAHDRKVLEAECDELGLPGRLGDLGILPGHTALLATLRPGEVWYRSGAGRHRIAVAAGFCEISNDRVTVLVESAWLPGEVDLAATREGRKAAEEALLIAGPEDLERLQDELASAEAQIAVAGAS